MRLLSVETSFVRFEIYGKRLKKNSQQQESAQSLAHLDVTSTDDTLTVSWVDTSGELKHTVGDGSGALFFEDTTYQLHVKSLLPALTPSVVHRDPYLLQDVDVFSDDRICTGSFNFRRQVGLSTFTTHVGNQTLRVTIKVFPVKIDYENDYKNLLIEVAAAGRGLALEYLRATYRSGTTTGDVTQATNVEWLTLLRNEIDTLHRAVRYLNDHPYRQLSRVTQDTKLERVRRIDASLRRAVIQRKGKGPNVTLPNIGPVHSMLPVAESRETLNTPEHRWLRYNLALVHNRLASIYADLQIQQESYNKSGHPAGKRLLREEEEIKGFLLGIQLLLMLPVFRGVDDSPPLDFPSLTLLNGPGYAEAYRTIIVLRLGLGILGEGFNLSVMDVHQLYESWCFIELAGLIISITKARVDASDLIAIEETGIRVRLRRGERSSISCKVQGTDVNIVVSYNPEFRGLTGSQKPDVVLRFQRPGWSDLIVVFDAKYRLVDSDDYKKSFGTMGPPLDAINALHRYRDAIVVETSARALQRPVVKGAALFPLSHAESAGYGSSRLYEALRVLGIGALPFLPGNTEWVHNWLTHLINLPTEDLAVPGPPFAGLSDLSRLSV